MSSTLMRIFFFCLTKAARAKFGGARKQKAMIFPAGCTRFLPPLPPFAGFDGAKVHPLQAENTIIHPSLPHSGADASFPFPFPFPFKCRRA